MGELFRRTIPSRSLNWTGERLISPMHGPIEDEHLHRYFVARELCRGKNVLDVASGEGYGTALLAQTALSAIGVEIDPNSVVHASSFYVAPNLKYLAADARNLPVDSNSIDVVVSFETLEHVSDHDRFLAEVARVLRPEGLLFISTPDPEVYSGPGVSPNPYHVRELSSSEFREALGRYFEHLAVYRQRAAAGSTIWPDSARCNGAAWIFDQRSADTFEAHRNLPRAPYLLAIASNTELPCLTGSFFLHAHESLDPGTAAELERLHSEIGGLRAAVETYMNQEAVVRERLEQADQIQKEVVCTREERTQLQAENRRFSQEIEQLSRDIDKDQDELGKARQELHNATLLGRQQALVAQRLQQEIQRFQDERRHLQQELRETQRELEASVARSEQAVRELSGLIVPVRLRKLLPTGLRPIARKIKRSLTT